MLSHHLPNNSWKLLNESFLKRSEFEEPGGLEAFLNWFPLDILVMIYGSHFPLCATALYIARGYEADSIWTRSHRNPGQGGTLPIFVRAPFLEKKRLAFTASWKVKLAHLILLLNVGHDLEGTKIRISIDQFWEWLHWKDFFKSFPKRWSCIATIALASRIALYRQCGKHQLPLSRRCHWGWSIYLLQQSKHGKLIWMWTLALYSWSQSQL